MKSKTLFKNIFLTIALSATYLVAAHSDGEIAKDAKQTAEDVQNSTKKAVRSAQDKTCNMVNGKLQCLGKKIKHKAQNASDDAKAAAR